jgi:hypothetical protein
MMFDRVDQQSATKQAGGAGGSTTYQAFLAADKAWSAVRNMPVGSLTTAIACSASTVICGIKVLLPDALPTSTTMFPQQRLVTLTRRVHV